MEFQNDSIFDVGLYKFSLISSSGMGRIIYCEMSANVKNSRNVGGLYNQFPDLTGVKLARNMLILSVCFEINRA